MPAVKTGMMPPPMPGMPAPMQPMGGMPPMPPMGGAPAQNPFIPMPPAPLAGVPQQSGGQGQQVQMGSNAGRRRRFGDALEGMMGGIGGAAQGGRSFAPAQMVPRQQMVAPGTPMMRTPTPRPMADGGIVRGYDAGGGVGDSGIVTDTSTGQEVVVHSGLRDLLNTFNPSTATYSIRDLDSGGTEQYTVGETYDDLPADVAYSKQVQENREKLGLAGNDSSAWAMYQRGEHWSQNQPASVGGTVDDTVVVDEVVSQPVTSLVGAGSGAGTGAGSAVGSGGNFGTGTYIADIVDDSQVGDIDYGQFAGDIGKFEGSQEKSALYGPKINIPQRVSQYYTDPLTGGLGTTYGSLMTAVSPIGAINLPARPVSLDINNFLSTPTYGTMYSGISPVGEADYGFNRFEEIDRFTDGGEAIPRRTNIYGVPHELSYINDEEKALLKGLGGMGTPGPGGVPQYNIFERIKSFFSGGGGNSSSSSSSSSGGGRDRDADAFAGSNYAPTSNAGTSEAKQTFTNVHTGETFDTAYDLHSSYGINDDDGPSTPAPTNVTPVPTGVVEITLPPTVADPNPPVIAEIDYGDGGDDTPVIEDVTYYDDTGQQEVAPPVVDVQPVYIDPTPAPPPAPPPVYTDRFGREYSSQEAADSADRAYAAQLASYGAGKEGFNRFADQASAPYISREESDRAASRIYTDNFRPELAQYDGPDIIGGLPSYNIPGVGGGDIPDVGGGVSPIEIIDPTVMPDQVDIFELPSEAGSPPVISLGEMGLRQPAGTPTSMYEPDRDSYDPRGDQIVSPTGTGIGRESDLQRGLGATGLIAARDADMDPFGTGTQVSLQDVKDRVARAEGTADEGGYNRLLGGQEGRFGVDLTNMTVQEVLDFQKQRGPGSYAEYSQGVNEQRGMTRADGSGVISTPAGKYQVVGATLEELIDKGVVDPNAKFDEGTQEKIGSYLIAERRGLNDLQAGNITRKEFEENLGKEFEGIKRGLDKGAGSTSLVLAAASQAGTKAEEDRRDANVAKIQQQIGDQAEPTGVEKFFYDVVGQLGFGLGKPLADKLRGESKENRQAIINQHVYALENGATPKTDEDGNYIGFDISTMDTFADKVLASENIMAFMPPSMKGGTFTVTQEMIDQLRASGMDAQADALRVGQTLNLPTTTNVAYQADADGDGVIDYDRFGQVYEAQKAAADALPRYDNFKDYLLGVGPAGSTEQGFITPDGKEFFVDAGGNVVEITDDVVPFEPGGGEDVAAALGVTETTTGDGEDTKNYTVGEDGTIICNQEGYVYSEAAGMCVPSDEVEGDEDTFTGTPTIGIGRGAPARSFEDVLAGITSPAPRIAPISENIRPMQAGGMVGLNRAADNFLKALAG